MSLIAPYIMFGGAPGFITNAVDTSDVTTHTYSGISFPAGNIIVGMYAGYSTGSITSLTIKGVTATARVTSVSDSFEYQGLWDATVTSGSGDIVIVTSNQFTRSAIAVWSAGTRSFVSGNTDTAANPLSLNLTFTTGDLGIIHTFVSDGSNPTLTPTGWLEDYEETIEVASKSHHGGFIFPAPSGATTIESDAGAVNADLGSSGIWR